MKIIKKLIIFIVLVVVLFYAWLYYYKNGFYLPDFSFESASVQIKLNEEQDSSTIFVPVLDSKIDKEKNVIYCSTFQLMWRALCKDVFDEPMLIKDAPDYASKLNSLIDIPVNVSPDSYFAIAGFGNDTVKKINQIGNRMFPGIFKNLTDNIGSTEIIGFSALYKNLIFKEKFESIDGIFRAGDKETKIKSFGTKENKENKFEKQVLVIYYDKKKPREFLIRLKSNSDSDEIFISTLKSENTLERAYEDVVKYYDKYNDEITNTKKNRILFDENSFLIIPKLKFELTYNYDKLISKEILNQKFKEKLLNNMILQYYVKVIVQYIKFDLNESGAKLYSTAKFESFIGNPLCLIIDGPFIIILKEKNSKTPYFMAYIGNDELLVKR